MDKVTLLDSVEELRYGVSLDQPDEDGLTQLMRELSIKKIWLCCLALLGAFLGVLAWTLIPERFTATAMVLVQPINTNLPGVTALGPPENSAGLFRSEAALIKSPNVLWESVTKLADSPLGIELVRPTVSDRVSMAICSALPGWVRPVAPVMRLCTSASGNLEAAETADFTGQVTPSQELVDRLGDRLDVEYNNVDFVLHISLWAQDPEVAAHAVNTVVETYIRAYQARQRDILLIHIATVSERVAALEKRVQEADDKVNAFRRENRLGHKDRGSITDQQLAEMSVQLSIAEGDLAASRALYDNARKADSATRLAELVDSQTLLQLRDREAEIAQNRAHLASDLGPRHPQIVSADQQLMSIRKSIQSETKRVLNGLSADVTRAQGRVASLRDSIANLEAKVVSDTDVNSQLAQLEQEAQAARNIYEDLLASYEHARSLNESVTSSITLVSPAKPPSNSSSFSLVSMALLGSVGSLVVGVLFLLLRHYRDVGFELIEDVGRAVDVRNVVSIPDDRHIFGRLSEITRQIKQAPNSALSETVRGLRSQILSSAQPDSGVSRGKTILVTSSLSGEGKSSLVLALAATSAMDGLQVLILECDLRCAAISEALGPARLDDMGMKLFARQPWASEPIVDPHTGAHLCLVETLTKLPHRYLQSNVIDPMLEHYKDKYDLIIIDTPPIMYVSDAELLIQRANFIIFVVSFGQAPKTIVKEAAKRIRKAGGMITGVAFTKVRRIFSKNLYAGYHQAYRRGKASGTPQAL